METCPYCGVYCNYIDLIPPSAEQYPYLVELYGLKEQTDVIKHVAQDHSTILLTEELEKEMKILKHMIRSIPK